MEWEANEFAAKAGGVATALVPFVRFGTVRRKWKLRLLDEDFAVDVVRGRVERERERRRD